MKQLALILSLALAAGVAFAGENTASTGAAKAPEVKAAKAAPAKTHDVAAEVVSIDTAKNTITAKTGEKGEESTAPVEGAKTQAVLKTLKAGQKVTLTCRDNDKGEHEAVTAIKIAKASAKAPAKAPAAEKPAKSN